MKNVWKIAAKRKIKIRVGNILGNIRKFIQKSYNYIQNPLNINHKLDTEKKILRASPVQTIKYKVIFGRADQKNQLLSFFFILFLLNRAHFSLPSVMVTQSKI